MDPNPENNRADPIESTKEVTNVSKTFVTYKYGKINNYSTVVISNG